MTKKCLHVLNVNRWFCVANTIVYGWNNSLTFQDNLDRDNFRTFLWLWITSIFKMITGRSHESNYKNKIKWMLWIDCRLNNTHYKFYAYTIINIFEIDITAFAKINPLRGALFRLHVVCCLHLPFISKLHWNCTDRVLNFCIKNDKGIWKQSNRPFYIEVLLHLLNCFQIYKCINERDMQQETGRSMVVKSEKINADNWIATTAVTIWSQWIDHAIRYHKIRRNAWHLSLTKMSKFIIYRSDCAEMWTREGLTLYKIYAL